MHKVYTNIIQIAGDVIIVEAEGVGYADIAEVATSRGTSWRRLLVSTVKRFPYRFLPEAAVYPLRIRCVS